MKMPSHRMMAVAGAILGGAVLAAALAAGGRTADKLSKEGAGAGSQPASASRPAEDQGKTDPPGLPLKATLVVKKNSYAIPAGQSGEQSAKDLKTPSRPPK